MITSLYSIRSGFGSRYVKFKAVVNNYYGMRYMLMLEIYSLLIVSNLNFKIIFLACVDLPNRQGRF